VFRDVTEQKLKERKINYLNLHDPLTGLFNRRYFARELARMDHFSHYPIGLMMLDLNGLKIINDAYGLETGDEALKKVGGIIRDTVGDRGKVSRIGGDEFTVLFSNIDDGEMATYQEHLKKNIQNKKIKNIPLSVAIGHTLKRNDETTFSDVMKEAEDMMYRLKLVEGVSARNKTIQAILNTLTSKFDQERRHSKRVGEISHHIGECLSLREDDLAVLQLSGMFHDIGKISIPDEILKKSGRLTDDEFDIIKTHTTNGYKILRAADEYSNLAEYALYHHEHYDGSGYPEGLIGEEIPLFARIIGIADAYEAMTADRPYRKALSHETAIKELEKHKGTQFDPTIVDAFINDMRAV
jgi:diguanylate cyclase (GGDEF)-like protein